MPGALSTIQVEPEVSLPLLDISRYPSSTVVTVDQCAVKCGISRAHLYNHIRAGRVQAWRNDRGQIRLLLEATRVQLKGLRK